MYAKPILAVLVAVAMLAAAAPGTADHGENSETTYLLGHGLFVASDDVEGTGLPGYSLGGGFHLLNPDAPDAPSVAVVDDVHGELAEGEGPLEYTVACEDGNLHCNVFVGPGAITGTITLG